MSLLRKALALSLLLGTSAQEPHKQHRAKGNLRHHKHHGNHKHHSSGLWSHGQKFELVLPDASSEATLESQDAGLVQLAFDAGQFDGAFAADVAAPSQPAKETQTAPHNADQKVHDQQPMAQGVVDPQLRIQESETATWAKAYGKEVRKIQKLQKAARKAATVPKASDEPTTMAKASKKTVSMAKDRKAAKEAAQYEAKVAAREEAKKDDQTQSTKQKSANSNTQEQGFAKIRQELRLAKRKDHQVKVLSKHLDAQLDMLSKSSELQHTAKTDEESARLLQQQTSQLEAMTEETKTRISESEKVARNAARLAAQQAEAWRDAARAEEKKAEEQLQQSKKAELEADKLDKIALKELRKVESKPKSAWIQEKATTAN